MGRTLRLLIAAILFTAVCLSALYVRLRDSSVAVFSGSDGVTVTKAFTVRKEYWDIKLVYFKRWSPFWSLRIEVYKEGWGKPVFSTSIILYIYPNGDERADLDSHPSLPAGTYYLKIYSKNVSWTIKVEEMSPPG